MSTLIKCDICHKMSDNRNKFVHLKLEEMWGASVGLTNAELQKEGLSLGNRCDVCCECCGRIFDMVKMMKENESRHRRLLL